MSGFKAILLLILILCALATSISRNLLTSVVIFTAARSSLLRHEGIPGASFRPPAVPPRSQNAETGAILSFHNCFGDFTMPFPLLSAYR